MKSVWFLIFTMCCPASAQLKFQDVVQKAELDPKEETVFISFPFSVERDTEISGYSSHCGCLKAITTQKLWTTGQKGLIKLKLDTRQITGTTRKSVEVNFRNAPQQKLTVEATMPPAISRSPKSNIWEQGSELEAKSYEIIIHGGFDFTIKDLVISNKKFVTKLIPDPKNDSSTDKKFTLKVTPPAIEGRQICMIKVITTSEIKRYQSFNLLAIKK